VGILLSTPLFGDLEVADVEELLPDLRERRYAKGEVVWLEGDPADELFIVIEGQLKSSRTSLDGREVILRVDTAGSVGGEIGMFHPGGIRWLNVSAMADTRCLILRRAPLLSFLPRHPQAMLRLLERLSIAAVNVAYHLSNVAFDDIPRRVAAALLLLSRTHGEQTSDGLRIDVRLSQSELAAHVAASRENVNRALSGLLASGVISQRAGFFYVHDLAALDQVGGGDGPATRIL
jgi:CRP-like cAMP-binding protein